MIKKVAHKAPEVTGKLIGNKITEEIVKYMPDENLRNVEEIVIPTEQREEIWNELRQVF